jgi:hypothetical protein
MITQSEITIQPWEILRFNLIQQGLRILRVGVQAVKLTTTGNNNVGVGVNALFSNTTGSQNIAVGNFALQNETTGGNDIGVGVNALFKTTTGFQNIAIGNFAHQNNITGNNNIAIGTNAFINDTSGSSNTAVGTFAGDLLKMIITIHFLVSVRTIQVVLRLPIAPHWVLVQALQPATRFGLAMHLLHQSVAQLATLL